MSAPYYADDTVTLWHGDALAVLRDMPDESLDCIVTSPPYFGLRDYGVEGQYGLESSPAEYVETMRAVFAEARRALANDGTLWLNLGDSFYSGRGNPGPNADRPGQSWSSPKNLLGVPWRVAFALQGDGWILRNDIIWAKPNGMPESVRDRMATKHEHVFLFAKSPRYWFDLDPIREPLLYPADAPQVAWDRAADKQADVPGQRSRQKRAGRTHGKAAGANLVPTGRQHLTPDVHGGRNPGDVWTFPTVPYAEAHFAVMPPSIAERCILAGCRPGGTVLDPFHGSGTTGAMAVKHGRRYVGIDLNREYLDLSLRTRLSDGTLDFDGGAA